MPTILYPGLSRKPFIAVSAALAIGVILYVHGLLLTWPAETATPLMMLDRLFDLGLAGLFSLAATGVGHWLLRKMGYTFRPGLAQGIWAWGIGAGIFSEALVLFGLVHLLSRPIVFFLLVSAFGLTAREWGAVVKDLWSSWQTRTPLNGLERMLVGVVILLVVPVMLAALTPPTEGDALTYQLATPAIFLDRQAIIPLPQNTGANYPLGTAMLFVFGLAAGSPIAAQLTHFLFGIGLMAAVYTFAREHFGRTAGLLGSAIFWTSAVVGLEGSSPLVDLGWVFYEFLAIWLYWQWHQTRSLRTLVLMAICLGLAVSSKYLGFVGWGTLALLVLVEGAHTYRRFWPVLQSAFIVGGVALVVAAPWFAKNLFLLGNPVYPFFLGAYGLDGQVHRPAGAALGMGDWVGAGMGNSLQALLSFPFNVYSHWQRFDPVMNRGGPSLFFWFLPFYLLVPKRAVINFLLLIAFIRFGVWWNLTQFVRYGLILFPLLSVIGGYVVWRMLERTRGRWRRPLLQIVVGLAFLVGICLQWGFVLFLREGTVPFLLGLQSTATYLDINLVDYQAVRFINTALPGDARIVALGDTRVFYAERSVLGDGSHMQWAELTSLGRTPKGVMDLLQRLGVTHVWVSEDEIAYAHNLWNIPEPWQDPLVSFSDFSRCCLERLYSDERGHSIYSLKPGLGTGGSQIGHYDVSQ